MSERDTTARVDTVGRLHPFLSFRRRIRSYGENSDPIIDTGFLAVDILVVVIFYPLFVALLLILEIFLVVVIAPFWMIWSKLKGTYSVTIFHKETLRRMDSQSFSSKLEAVEFAKNPAQSVRVEVGTRHGGDPQQDFAGSSDFRDN